MNHPHELLPDYAMGLLEGEELKHVETHLENCEVCQTEVRALRDAFHALAQVEPPATAGTQRSPHRLRLSRVLLAAAAAIILLIGANAWWQHRQLLAYLTDPDVVVRTIPPGSEQPLARVFVRQDGRALIVMTTPPPDRHVYQAWGHGPEGPVSLGLTRGRLLEVPYHGFKAVGVSLEPPGGSPQPTRPLGRIPL